MKFNIVSCLDYNLYKTMIKVYRSLEDDNFFNKIETFETKQIKNSTDRREIQKIEFNADKIFNKYFDLIITKGRVGREIVNKLSCPLCNIFEHNISKELSKIKV
jgi:hypothetical protein